MIPDKTLILPVGLPRSGKSTWSLEQAMQHGHVIVNPDSIRLALYGLPYRPEADPMVWAIAKYMVTSLFLAGHPVVILDACNLTEHRRLEWVSTEWKTVLHLVPTDADTCVHRAVSGGRVDLVQVIDRFDLGKQDPKLDIREWTYV